MNPAITQLIENWRNGSQEAEHALIQVAFPVLRELAAKQLRQSNQRTLRPTELANDVFMKLRAQDEQWNVSGSTHFYSLAARMIRFLIIDHVRTRLAERRGGDVEIIQLEFVQDQAAPESAVDRLDWLALHEALNSLEVENARYAQLVELRYFMGMTIQESADVLAISTATADRMWRYSRAFLADRIGAS
jgi:RNA polymerase sigma factor (TIGR02999 family)